VTIEDIRAVEDFELAFARLDWVRAAACLDLPSQREALAWHVACCEAALSAVDRDAVNEEARDEQTPSR
jgi:hypothetical protein